MPYRVEVLLSAEDNQHTQAVPAHDQRNGAIRPDSLEQIVLLGLKLELFLQVPAHDCSLVLEYPSMMAFFAVQR